MKPLPTAVQLETDSRFQDSGPSLPAQEPLFVEDRRANMGPHHMSPPLPLPACSHIPAVKSLLLLATDPLCLNKYL